ncbi:MAG: 4'-phosphopantetheinyl transferase family protein [Bacteroidaceae bacterium]
MILCLNDHIQDMKGDTLHRVLAFLPLWRRERALAYRHEQGQTESALAYLELSRALALSGYGDIKPEFEYNEHGKPFLPLCPELHFSISHCQRAVGCLLAQVPCGLDIERIRSISPALVKRTMNSCEEKQICSAPSPEVEFARLWTRKEAVFKLLGTGITDAMPDILNEARLLDIRCETIANPARGYVFSTALQTD